MRAPVCEARLDGPRDENPAGHAKLTPHSVIVGALGGESNRPEGYPFGHPGKEGTGRQVSASDCKGFLNSERNGLGHILMFAELEGAPAEINVMGVEHRNGVQSERFRIPGPRADGPFFLEAIRDRRFDD